MIQSIKHFVVNWTDGMKISEKHLRAHDDFILDSIRDASSLRGNQFDYGLLPMTEPSNNGRALFDVYNTATNDVQIVINNCHAITAAGYRIDLTEYKTNIRSLSRQLNEDGSQPNSDYYILIAVNPFERIPFGDIDPEETPPRHPFTQSKYIIELLPKATLSGSKAGGNYLVIGKVNLRENIAEADLHFIPPCTGIQSHPALVAYYGSFAKSMANLQQHAVLIVQKAVKTNQNTALAHNVRSLCTTLTDHFAHSYFRYRNIIPQMPPVYMIEIFAGMALQLFNNTQSLAPAALEEMLNYAFEWSEVAPHALLNQLSAVAEINYDHNDCGGHLVEIDRLLNSMELIFSKLSSLDYIGQRKENIIVNEKDITPVSKAKKGWSLLD